MKSGLSLFVVGMLLLLGACNRVIVPRGEPTERANALREEGVFATQVNKRPLPELSADAPLPQVLEYAFNANGEIETAYREWRAAIERVVQAGALPDPRIDFGTTFNATNVKSFSGILNSVMLGASQELPGRGKRQARAGQALTQAQATGERFRKAKYELQRKVVRAYAALALNAKMTALTSDTLRLFQQTNDVAAHRYHLGSETPLADLRKIEVEIQTKESDRRALEIERHSAVAELNGLLNRKADAPLGRVTLPAIQFTSDTVETLFARAVRSNPELAALRKEIDARGVAQTLAELERKPDYMIGGKLEYSFVDPKGLMPGLDLGMTLPINRERIRAGIAEALAMRQAAEAKYRGAEADTLARLLMSLSAIRNTRRIEDDYQNRILPRTNDLLDAQLATYGSGGGEILDILDTERTQIELKKVLIQAEADRLRFISELEEILGEDLFQFIPATRAPQESHQ